VRAVSVETGKVRWSGSAAFETTIVNPETHALQLISVSLIRAICQEEKGEVWIQPNEGAYGGKCVPKGTQTTH
jgi:hypothetical protein